MRPENPLRLRRYEINSHKWPARQGVLNILFLSDFHVGCPSVSLGDVEGIVRQANALSRDIVFLGGDFLSKAIPFGHYVPPAPIAEALAGLRAPLGIYAVLGNHDWRMDGEGMWRALEQAGVRVLENSALRVENVGGSFWVAGLADHTMRKPDYRKTMADVTGSDPVLLLSHDPKDFADVDDRPVLTLCGHTHGGQVRLPQIGPVILPGKVPRKYAYGHIHEGGRDMIVSGGIGESILPLRFGMKPEIVQISLSSAKGEKDV